jgi:putative phosphoesterase
VAGAIGVIADTHVPEFRAALPPGLARAFAGVELILHAGDVTGAEVLDELRTIAPVVAVRGDHDDLDLPEQTVVEVDGARIGLVHGQRRRLREWTGMAASELAGHPVWNGVPPRALRRFDGVDAVVFGHVHRPLCERRDGVLLFSPGAVHHLTPEAARDQLAFERRPLHRIYLRRRLRHPLTDPRPTVGLLHVDGGRVEGEIVTLD